MLACVTCFTDNFLGKDWAVEEGKTKGWSLGFVVACTCWKVLIHYLWIGSRTYRKYWETQPVRMYWFHCSTWQRAKMSHGLSGLCVWRSIAQLCYRCFLQFQNEIGDQIAAQPIVPGEDCRIKILKEDVLVEVSNWQCLNEVVLSYWMPVLHRKYGFEVDWEAVVIR